MVKWLEEITVSAEPSANFYHFHDNRVLPSHVTEKMAKDEGTEACAVPSMMHTRKRETTLGCLMDTGPNMT